MLGHLPSLCLRHGDSEKGGRQEVRGTGVLEKLVLTYAVHMLLQLFDRLVREGRRPGR